MSFSINNLQYQYPQEIPRRLKLTPIETDKLLLESSNHETASNAGAMAKNQCARPHIDCPITKNVKWIFIINFRNVPIVCIRIPVATPVFNENLLYIKELNMTPGIYTM